MSGGVGGTISYTNDAATYTAPTTTTGGVSKIQVLHADQQNAVAKNFVSMSR